MPLAMLIGSFDVCVCQLVAASKLADRGYIYIEVRRQENTQENLRPPPPQIPSSILHQEPFVISTSDAVNEVYHRYCSCINLFIKYKTPQFLYIGGIVFRTNINAQVLGS
jgi:hypothetical protein